VAVYLKTQCMALQCRVKWPTSTRRERLN